MPILVFNLMYLSTVQKPSPNETDLEDTRSFFFFFFFGRSYKTNLMYRNWNFFLPSLDAYMFPMRYKVVRTLISPLHCDYLLNWTMYYDTPFTRTRAFSLKWFVLTANQKNQERDHLAKPRAAALASLET